MTIRFVWSQHHSAVIISPLRLAATTHPSIHHSTWCGSIYHLTCSLTIMFLLTTRRLMLPLAAASYKYQPRTTVLPSCPPPPPLKHISPSASLPPSLPLCLVN